MATNSNLKSIENLKQKWLDYLKPAEESVVSRCLRSINLFPEVMRNWPINFWFFPVDFTDSHTAVKLGIKNIPDSSSWDNIITLVTSYLIPLRAKIKLPIIISSGYRSSALNKAVNGASRSYHMQGRACDIRCNNNLAMYNALVRIAVRNRDEFKSPLMELIQYSNFIHFAI